ncbi:MAG: rod shape-determining protein MreD [Bacillota bacterium]
MRYLVLFLIPFLSIFFESTLFGRFTLRGVGPDLMLIFVVFYAIIYGSRKGFSYGFLCGLFEDLYVGRFIGMNALSKGLTAYLIGKLEVNVFKDNLLVGFGGVVLATVFNSIVMLLIAILSMPHLVLDKSMLLDLSGQLVYNGLLSVPFYIWYYKSARSGWLKESKYRG